MGDLRGDLIEVINRHSAENGSNTPDYILADYLIAALRAFDDAARSREGWYGRNPMQSETGSDIANMELLTRMANPHVP